MYKKNQDLNLKLDTFKYTSFKRASSNDKKAFKISMDGIITKITMTIITSHFREHVLMTKKQFPP